MRSYDATAWTEDHSGDCAVVLTGGPNRAREGLDLLAQKNVKKLIITGTNPSSDIDLIFPEWPYYGDLRESDVILEKHSQTTYGNAQQAQAIVEALEKTRYNKTAAAKLLGLSFRQLRYRIKKLGIDA